jgi:hypothetical protein
MQQDADFIAADFLYMFPASSAHHQEYKILTRQTPVQVVMVAGGSSFRHTRRDADFITADFLYMFRASCDHHQECKILTRQPPVQVVL